MKKITLLCISLAFCNLGYSQNLQLQELLIEYQNIPPNGKSIQHFFNSEEIVLLKDYFSQQTQYTESNQGANNGIIYGINSDGINEFVSFSVNNPSTLSFINNSLNTTDFEACGDIDPTDLNNAFVLTLQNGDFYELNITSGVYTFLGVIAPPSGEQWTGIEFDPSTNLLYGVSTNFVNSSTVSIIDKENLSFTTIGPTGTAGTIAIATDGNGNFFSYDIVLDSVYSIDITTGTATFMNGLDFNANFGQDLEWDSASQSLYMTAFNSDNLNAELRLVDTTTGVTQFIGNISAGSDAQIPWAGIQNVSTLTTEDFQANTFTLFPNPATNSLRVQSNSGISSIAIYNSIGQKVETHTPPNSLEYDMSIAHLSKGVYFIELQTSLGILTEKLVKN